MFIVTVPATTPNQSTLMKNFFFAPSKACLESDAIAAYLRTLGNIKVAEPNQQANSNLLKRLAHSYTRSDVTHIGCILAAPTVNIIIDEMEIAVGRGLTDIGDEALVLGIDTYILRQIVEIWFFYPVINLDRSRSKNDWKLDYSRAILGNPQTAEELFS
jgi:hypothetical protein